MPDADMDRIDFLSQHPGLIELEKLSSMADHWMIVIDRSGAIKHFTGRLRFVIDQARNYVSGKAVADGV